RIDERLIAVAQVDRAPDRRRLDASGRPGAVVQSDEGIGFIFPRGVGHALGGGGLRLCVHFVCSRRPAATQATPNDCSCFISGLARSLAARGGTIDRRALLQRTRRSPIRPRSSRAEESARKVSAAKAG